VGKLPIFAILTMMLLDGCAGPAGQTSSAAPAGAFPLTVTRRGGFAGVDDSARIAADGSAVVTHRGQSPVSITLPATTMDELRHALATPAQAGASTCSDGYEYTIVSPSGSTVIHGCDASQNPLVAVADLVVSR
jgi:hypothetical protein